MRKVYYKAQESQAIDKTSQQNFKLNQVGISQVQLKLKISNYVNGECLFQPIDFFSQEESDDFDSEIYLKAANKIWDHQHINQILLKQIEIHQKKKMKNAKVYESSKDNPDGVEPNLENKSSFFSKVFFLWTHTIIKKGYSMKIQEKDLYDILEHEKLLLILEDYKLMVKEQPGHGLSYYMIKISQNKLIIALITSLIIAALQFAGPVFLNLLIRNMSDPTSDIGTGYLYCSLLFACFLIKAVLAQHLTHITNQITFKSANLILGLMYNKLMRLSSTARKYIDAGKMTNLVIMNTMEVLMFFMFAFTIMTAPPIIIAASVYIIYELGYVGCVAPVLLIISSFLVNEIEQKQIGLRRGIFVLIDKRCQQITEYFSGIKIIKYYAWEEWVMKVLQKVRQSEINFIFKFLFNIGQVECISQVAPSIIAVLVFILYIVLENNLDAAKAYTVLSLINMLQVIFISINKSFFGGPLIQLISGYGKFNVTKISYDRILHFLDSEEISDNFYDKELMNQSQTGEIRIIDGTFSWESLENEKHNIDNPDRMTSKLATIKEQNKQLKANNQKIPTLQASIAALDEKSIPALTPPSLLNINLHFKPATFNGIYGLFSSGKTTLAHALINELFRNSGKIAVKGTVAFIPQIPWLRSCSVKDNILFGEKYDRKRYNQVIKICELTEDLAALPGGDLTEIGERGVNLSGGQKQRVSIARAVYSNRDIFIVDDCLSALDSHVGKKIFDLVFKQYLKEKTIVFITHHQHYMSKFDTISIIKDSTIADHGTYAELRAKNSEALSFLQTEEQKNHQANNNYNEAQNDSSENSDNVEQEVVNKEPHKVQQDHEQIELTHSGVQRRESVESNLSKDENKKKQGKLTYSEDSAVGSVPFSIYLKYINLGGYGLIFLAMIVYCVAQTSIMMSDWWLGKWSLHSFTDLDNSQYAGIYAGLSLFGGILFLVRYLVFLIFSLTISKNVFKSLLSRLLKAPMGYYDTTPLGRIVARFTRDIDVVDFYLQMRFQSLIGGGMSIIGSLVLISLATPYFLILGGVLIVVYYFILKLQIPSSREIKRIVDVVRAPIIGVYSELNSGLIQIRSMEKANYFMQTFVKCIDNHTRAMANSFYCDIWLNMITDIFAAFVIAASAYLGIIQKQANPGDYSLTALYGLSLTWALKLSLTLPVTIRVIADTEKDMNSFHRLLDSISETPQERPHQLEQKDQQNTPQNWLVKPNIDIKSASYRYRNDTPIVLKSLSLSIKANEKIGVIGRTGSGKSTLTLAILRILELEDEKQGSITLDSTNVAELGLQDLRSKVSMIPQDPILFQGTIRSNIDPFSLMNDEVIIDALQKVSLLEPLAAKVVEDTPAGGVKKQETQTEATLLNNKDQNEKVLSMKVEAGGSNFSQGEKQLIALCRVIIRNSKVLLMDEATASIDEKTDWIIQNMIRTHFKQTTILTIAHRLKTIIQYDKILVLGDGEIKEFDSPKAMLSKPDSYLSFLIKQNGEQQESEMRALALESS